MLLKNNSLSKDIDFINRFMIKGKFFFWIGSLMSSSSITWLFTSLQDWNDANSLKIPIIFLVIGVMLMIMFKECQFFTYSQYGKLKKH